MGVLVVIVVVTGVKQSQFLVYPCQRSLTNLFVTSILLEYIYIIFTATPPISPLKLSLLFLRHATNVKQVLYFCTVL